MKRVFVNNWECCSLNVSTNLPILKGDMLTLSVSTPQKQISPIKPTANKVTKNSTFYCDGIWFNKTVPWKTLEMAFLSLLKQSSCGCKHAPKLRCSLINFLFGVYSIQNTCYSPDVVFMPWFHRMIYMGLMWLSLKA